MKNILKLSILFIIGLFSCKSDSVKTSTAPTPTPVATQAPVVQKPAERFTAIPREDVMFLFQNCDYTDYIFHELPFSMSQSTENSIKANISYISDQLQPFIPNGCKAIARQMFHVKGEIVTEMDVYYGDNCAFYALIKNEKIVAANKMTDSGLAFYKQMIEQGMKQRQRVGQ